MMISDILDDGGNIQKQMQKTTTVQIQVCTGLSTNLTTSKVTWADRYGPQIHYLLTNISNRNKTKIFVASSV